MSVAAGLPVPPVLVVDDDSSIRRLFSLTLQRADIATVEATNGRHALELIGSHTFSCVLLDNHMPEMDGLQVIEVLRNNGDTETLPVILVTGAGEVDQRVLGLQVGANDYLTKPVELQELVARVRAQVRGSAAWSHRVEGHLRERAAIARALAQIRPADTPEATAQIICTELSLLHSLDRATMFAFLEGDQVLPIGSFGEPVLGEEVGRPIDKALANRLTDRCQQGPWTERTEDLYEKEGAAPAALAFAPMVADGQLLGLLVLATDEAESDNQRPGGVPGGAVTQALSAAIDFATIAAGLLAPALMERGRDRARHALLAQVIDRNEFFPVFQPIVELGSKEVVGYETLTRFHDGVRPDLRFIEAALLGRGVDLEAATLARALEAAVDLPTDSFLSINVSPALVLDVDTLAPLLARTGRQIVLELTEHEQVNDYGALRAALGRLGPDTKLSVDDAGAGFASLRHVLSLRPHYVKLDLSLVRNIHTDPARQALVTGIEYFATETESRLIAEGIEYPEEMATLVQLDVEFGQGYLLGRPAPLEDHLATTSAR